MKTKVLIDTIIKVIIATILIYMAVDKVTIESWILVTCGEILLALSGMYVAYHGIKDTLGKVEEKKVKEYNFPKDHWVTKIINEVDEEIAHLRKVNAIIEQADDGTYSVFMDADDMDYLVTGTGKTLKEAIDCFKKGYEDTKVYFEETGKDFEEVEFNYVLSVELI